MLAALASERTAGPTGKAFWEERYRGVARLAGDGGEASMTDMNSQTTLSLPGDACASHAACLGRGMGVLVVRSCRAASMLARQDRMIWRFAAVSGNRWQRAQVKVSVPASSSSAAMTGVSHRRHHRWPVTRMACAGEATHSWSHRRCTGQVVRACGDRPPNSSAASSFVSVLARRIPASPLRPRTLTARGG